MRGSKYNLIESWTLVLPCSLSPCPTHPPTLQHPDTCGVSVHPECTGMPFPSGPYICMNHDDRQLKTRVRRRASSALARDSGLGSDTDSTTEEEGGAADSGDAGSGGGKRKADADSEATISEETASLDSSATEDEGTSKRRRKR